MKQYKKMISLVTVIIAIISTSIMNYYTKSYFISGLAALNIYLIISFWVDIFTDMFE